MGEIGGWTFERIDAFAFVSAWVIVVVARRLADSRGAMPTKDDFREELRARFRRATERGAQDIVINSGELHRALGGYPGQGHQMPSCCDAMREAMRSTDEEISSPPGGRGATLSVRYLLPR